MAATADAAEPSTDGQFTVTLTGPSQSETIVSYLLLSGDATAGADYMTLSGSVTIPAGATSATIDVNVIDDSTPESDESVTILLSGITAGDPNIDIGLIDTATVTISDDGDVGNVVVARHIFYNDSEFDGNDPAAGAA